MSVKRGKRRKRKTCRDRRKKNIRLQRDGKDNVSEMIYKENKEQMT